MVREFQTIISTERKEVEFKGGRSTEQSARAKREFWLQDSIDRKSRFLVTLYSQKGSQVREKLELHTRYKFDFQNLEEGKV